MLWLEEQADRDQFAVRMNRAKAKPANLDAKVASQIADEDSRAYLEAANIRVTYLSKHPVAAEETGPGRKVCDHPRGSSASTG